MINYTCLFGRKPGFRSFMVCLELACSASLSYHNRIFDLTCRCRGIIHISGTPASNLGYLAPPQDNFSWVPNCSLEPPGWETNVSSKKFWFQLCEIAWFLCRPIANLRRGSVYKITHISAVTYPRPLNLIPN